MRTTITISESIYRAAKSRAAENGQTVSEVIEDAIRGALSNLPMAVQDLEPLPVFRGGRVVAGVDLNDNAAVRDLLDEDIADAYC